MEAPNIAHFFLPTPNGLRYLEVPPHWSLSFAGPFRNRQTDPVEPSPCIDSQRSNNVVTGSCRGFGQMSICQRASYAQKQPLHVPSASSTVHITVVSQPPEGKEEGSCS